MNRLKAFFSLFLFLALAVLPGAQPARAQAPAPTTPLDREQILIYGLRLQPSPSHQVVPKNTVTAINVSLLTPDGQPASFAGSAQGAIVAQLRGPAFAAPIQISGVPNQLLYLPPLPLAGLYVLENIRLVADGRVVLQGIPDAVTIEVIDRVLASQVTTRPLTAQELLDKGIVFDEDNFRAVNFTVAIGVQGQKIPVSFPMLLPKSPSKPSQGPSFVPRPPAGIGPPRPPQQPRMNLPGFELTNMMVSGFALECVSFCDINASRLVPPIPGVLIFPGNIAYLNQYFSALLLVSNVAPGYSNLVVNNVQAEIILPTGKDTVANTGDDPLRMAKLGAPPVEQSKIQPVVQPGPDGKLGSADDIPTLAPGQDGNSEFLIEGRRQGIHTVDVKITATLEGLPGGPVQLQGRAVGVLEVRDPTFALTFNHPRTVAAGEEYDFFITVSNISDTPANFVSLNLLKRSISGAELLSDEHVPVETILPGDSATASFRLRSLQTGSVIATSLDSDVPGKLEFRLAVGELGIPLSPNTLQFPHEVNSLPPELRAAATGLLGQAYALATAPFTPPGLLPLRKGIVYQRTIDLAVAGQRLSLGEPLTSVLRDLALDFTGNNIPRLTSDDEITPADEAAFDRLLRTSRRGAAFLDALTALLLPAVQNAGPLGFQADFAQQVVSRSPHLSVVAGGDSPAPVQLLLTDPQGRRLSATEDAIPNASHFNFASIPAEMALLAAPQNGLHVLELVGAASGNFDLGVILPDGNGLRRLVYPHATMTAGGRGRLLLDVNGVNDFILWVDADGDGQFETSVAPTLNEPVAEAGPQVISAWEMGSLDSFGRIMAVLFDEQVSPASAQSGALGDEISHYDIEANEALGVALQPSGRVALLRLRDGLGPFIQRTVTVSEVADIHGNLMAPISVTAPISPTTCSSGLIRCGGTVSGQVRKADGTPVPFAEIVFQQKIPVFDKVKWETITRKQAGADGRYSFDFVSSWPSSFAASDPASGASSKVLTQIRYAGQHLDVDIILPGTGTLVGRVLAADGTTPLPNAEIGVESLNRFGARFVATSDANGVFAIGGAPVGPLSIVAVHRPTASQLVAAGLIERDGQVVTQDLVLFPVSRPGLPPPGSVSGRVLRSDGVTPVAGVPVFTNKGGVTTTDDEGRYRINNLQPGPARVESFDEQLFESASVKTTIVSGQNVVANLILFGGNGTVTGSVIDAAGQPVAGAQIYGGWQVVTTDASGQFTLPDMPVGERDLAALVPNTQVSAKLKVNLTQPGENVAVQFRLPAYGVIAGRVTLADGVTPAANVDVILLGREGGGNYFTETDATGAYRVENALAGVYKITSFLPTFSDANVIETRLVAHRQTVRADIRYRGKGQLKVRLFDDDGATPLAGQVLLSEVQMLKDQLIPSDNPECLPDITVGDVVIKMPPCKTIISGFALIPANRGGQTDATTGEATFDNVIVGGVRVEGANAFNGGAQGSGIVPAPGATAIISLTLQSASQVSGTVYQPDGVTPVGADVTVEFNGRLKNVTVVTDENGRFWFPLVNAGGFSVTAEDPVSGLQGQRRGSVDAGRSAIANIRLLGKGSVAAQVVGTSGAPIANAPLQLVRGGFPAQSLAGLTNASGWFTFTDSVFEGGFSVRATNPGNGAKGSRSGRIDAPGGFTTVRVTILDEAGTVNGRFVLADGTTPAVNAQIELRSNFEGREDFTSTDATGAFVFEGVPKAGFSLTGYDFSTNRSGKASGAITANGQTVAVTITAQPLGSVTGLVTAASDGSPVAGAEVTLKSGGFEMVTTSGLNGSYTFPSVPAGSFNLTARDNASGATGKAGGSLSSEGQMVTANIVVAVPPPTPVGRVEGYVRDATGAVVVGAQVTLSYGRTARNATVDDDGFYFFDGAPLGAFNVLAQSPIPPDAGSASGSLGYNGEVVQVDVQLVGTGTIYGVVRSGAGMPVGFAEVKLTRQGATPAAFKAQTFADASGHFTFTKALAGNLSLSAKQPATNLGGSASTALAAGETVNVTITLQAAGSITGRVLRQNGVTPAEKMTLDLSSGGKHRYELTDAAGVFTYTDIALGDYTLLVNDALGEGIANRSATLASQGQLLDLGDIVLDEASPQVIAIAPAAGSQNIPVTQTIAIDFSEPVKASTVNSNNILVTTGATKIAGNLALDGTGARALFTPTLPLPSLGVVVVKVKTGVTDLVGKPLVAESVASFTTRDITPPAIVSLSPAPGALNVALESVVRVTFGEPIDPTQFVEPVISLRHGGVSLSGQIVWINANTVAIFTPNSPLLPNRVYSVTVQPASDLSGNRQPNATSYTFDSLDIEIPQITALTAQPGTTVLEGQSATVEATVDANDVAFVEFFVNGQLARTDTAAPFGFVYQAPALGSQTVQVTARATDNAGNVSPDASLTLHVQSDLPPAATILSPAAGAGVAAGGKLTVTVQAQDDVGVAQMTVQATGAMTTSRSTAVAPASQDKVVTLVLDVAPSAPFGGAIAVRAGAVDTRGQSGASPTLTVFVTGDAARPSVQIASPANNALVAPGAVVAVTVNASDNHGVAALSLTASGAASLNESRAISPTQTAVSATFSLTIPANAAANQTVTVVAQAQDAGGNASTPAQITLKIADVLPPTVQPIAPSGHLTVVVQGDVVNLTVAASDNVNINRLGYRASGAVSASGSKAVSPIKANASDNFSLLVPAATAPGGVIVVTGVATDTSSNVGQSAPISLTVLADGPPVVNITTPISGSVVAVGLPFTVTVAAQDDLGVTQVQLTSSGALSATQTVAVSPAKRSHTAHFVVNVPVNIAPGTPLTLTVRASDARGQLSSPAAAVVSVGDLTPPLVTFLSPANNAFVQPGGATNVIIRANDPSLIAQVDVAVSGVVTLSQSSVISPARSPVTVTLPITIPAAPANALIVVRARAVDAPGNLSNFVALNLRVADVTPPAVTLASSANAVVAGNSVTLTVSASDDVGLSGLGYAATGAVAASANQALNGAPPAGLAAFVLPIPASLTAGERITVTGAATDTAGNQGASAPLVIDVLADQPPQVVIVSPADNSAVGVGDVAAIRVDVSDDVGVTHVRLRSSGAVSASLESPLAPAQKNAAVLFDLPIPADAPLGVLIHLEIEASDTRGQISSQATLTLTTADLTPPQVQIISPADDALVDPGQTVQVAVAAQDNLAVAQIHLAASGALAMNETRMIQPPTTPVTTTFVVTVPAAATGNDAITLTAHSSDPSTNASQPVSITLRVRDVLAPQATLSVTPPFTRVVVGGGVTATVHASDEVALTSIGFTASGAVSALGSQPVNPPTTTGSASFRLNTPVTATVGMTITIRGNAIDSSGNNSNSAPIVLTLVQPGAQVVGVVTNLQNQAVAGALVTVTAVNGVFAATTGPDGRYALGVVQPGPISVQAVDPATSQNGRVDGVVGPYDVQVTVNVQVSGRPLVAITSPTANATLVRGETIPFSANASDDLGIVNVEFWVNGELNAVDDTAPYSVNYLVPGDATALVFSAFATDVEGNRVQAADVFASAVDDPLTTVSGQAVNTLGAPVAGAVVKVIYTTSNTQHPLTTTTNISGFFTIGGVATLAGPVRADIMGDAAGTTIKGSSTVTLPVRGGVTNVGVVLLRANVCWDGGGNGASWHDARNWCQDTLPGPVDDVIISVAANPTIVHSQGDDVIQSLVSDEAFTLSGGSLRVAGAMQVNAAFNLQGGTLISATVQPGGSGQGVTVLGTSSVVAGVTMNANLSLAVNGQNVALKVRDGLTLNSTATLGRSGDCDTGRLDFEGAQTLGGTGTVVFADRHNTLCADSRFIGLRVVNAGTTLTIGPGITVRGGEGFIGYSDQIAGSVSDIGVRLQGTVQASVGDAEMRIQGQNWRNEGGRIIASVGALYIGGATIDNSGQTLDVTGAGLVRLSSSAIVGGVVSGTTASRLTFIGSNTLDGVDLTGLNLTLGQNGQSNAVTTVRNGLTLNGAATLGVSGDCETGRFDFEGTQTLSGTGTVLFVDRHNTLCADSRFIGLRVVNAGTTLTIGPNITVRGGEGFIGYSDGVGGPSDIGVRLQGTVQASVGDAEMRIQGQNWRNEGGRIIASVGALYIGGATIDNSGQTLDVTGGGLIRLSGSAIVGGVVSGTTASRLTFIGSNTLDGVNLTGLNLTLGQNGQSNAVTTVRNGLTLNGAATLGVSNDCETGRFDFEGTQTLGGTGTVVFANRHDTLCADSRFIGLRVVNAGTTLTIGPNITVRGGEGFIGYSDQIAGSVSDIGVRLQGTVQASVGDVEMRIQGQNWRNEGGRIIASVGGIYIGGATIDNSGQTLDVTGGGLVRLSSSAIVGGVVSGTTASRLTFIGGNTLDGVDLTGLNLTLGQNNQSNAVVTVRNGLTLNGTATLGVSGDCETGRFDFDGTQTLGGTGTVLFVDRHNTLCADSRFIGLRVVNAGTTLTIGPNITVRGGEGFIGYSDGVGGPSDIGVVFKGVLRADTGDAEMLLRGQNWRNEGGRIVASVGGIYISGATIDNSGQTLDVTGGGLIRLSGSAIVGGVVSGTTASRLTFIGANTLDGVNMTGLNLTLGQNNQSNAVTTVRNGLTLNGTATLGVSNDCETGRFDFEGTQTLGGTGTVLFVDRHNTLCADSRDIGLRVLNAETTLTIGPGIAVSGGEGFVGYSSKLGGSESFVLVNQGRIRSSGSGSLVIVRGATLVNEGVMEMGGGGSLTAQGGLTNNGLVDTGAANPGTLSLTGSYTQALTGQLRVDIRGTAAGTQFGRLTVSGKATLDGVLNVSRSTNFLPTVGATFRVVSSGSRAGEFSALLGAEIDATRHFSPTYDATGSVLRVLAGPAGAAVATPTLGATPPVDCQGALATTADAASAANQYFTNLLRIDGEPFPCLEMATVAAQEQQFTFGPATLSGVQVTRKLFAPADGRFVRYLETLTNNSDAPRAITVTVEGYLASAGATRLVIDPFAQATSYAVVDGDLYGPTQLPVLAQVFAGPGAAAPPAVEFANGSGGYVYRWVALTLQPGQSAALLHFVAAASPGDVAGATAHAQALSLLQHASSLTQMSDNERAWVVNFAIAGQPETPPVAPDPAPDADDQPERIFLPVIMGDEANAQNAPSASSETPATQDDGQQRVYLPLVGR